MDSIAWGMRHGISDQAYQKLMAECFPFVKDGEGPVDPFQIDLTGNQAHRVYIQRQAVEQAVCRLGNQIILGPSGTGKTMLFHQLPSLLQTQFKGVLVPSFSLCSPSLPSGQPQAMEACRILAPHALGCKIFDAYWESLFHDDTNRTIYLPELRQNRQWMDKLAWFWHRYEPHRPSIAADFELMNWLQNGPAARLYGSAIPAEDALRDLVAFITAAMPGERYGRLPELPYRCIQIVVDRSEYLIEASADPDVAIGDVQRLYDLGIDNLWFTLLADAEMRADVDERLACAKQGRISIYHLPPWEKEDLRRLLYRRVNAWRDGEYAEEGFDWAQLIPGTYLKPAAQSQLTETIVNSALRAYETAEDGAGLSALCDGLDAPIHLLHLARGLVAGCAGSWAEPRYAPPLDKTQLSELANTYWRSPAQ